MFSYFGEQVQNFEDDYKFIVAQFNSSGSQGNIIQQDKGKQRLAPVNHGFKYTNKKPRYTMSRQPTGGGSTTLRRYYD